MIGGLKVRLKKTEKKRNRKKDRKTMLMDALWMKMRKSKRKREKINTFCFTVLLTDSQNNTHKLSPIILREKEKKRAKKTEKNK